MSDPNSDGKICDIEKEGKTYTLLKDFKKDQIDLTLTGKNDQELLRFHTQEIFDKFSNYNPTMKGQISAKEATFTKENSRAKMTIVVQNLGIEKSGKQQNNALLFVFVQIK